MLQIPDFDLDGAFVRSALSDHVKELLSIVDKAETLPSCSKIATSALVHSCSVVEGSVEHDSKLPPGSDLLIEEESNIYAARLAVCELSGADFSVPTACRSFVPAAGGKKTTTFRGWLSSTGASKPRISNYYDEVTAANLKQCRKALGSSSQAWTSYSNNRQNAVTMCHAMQSAVERDEARHVTKILATTAAATSESLHDAYERINEFKQLFHDLRTAMPDFQTKLASFDMAIQQQVEDYWSQLERATSGLQSLTTSIHQAKDDAVETQAHLDKVLNRHLPELSLAIAKSVKDISESADAATDRIAYTVQLMQQDVTEALHAAGHGLARINELMPQLIESMQNHVDSTLESFEAVTVKQWALNHAQNETLDGFERIQQKAQTLDSTIEGVASTMTNMETVVSRLDPLFSPLATLLEYNTMSWIGLVCSIAFGLFSVPFWHDYAGCSSWTAKYAAVGSMIGKSAPYLFERTLLTTTVCGCGLHISRHFIAAIAEALLSTSSSLSANALPFLALVVVTILALLLMKSRWFSRRSHKAPLCDVEYDPASPPYGLQAEALRWPGRTKLEEVVVDHRPTSLPKSRV